MQEKSTHEPAARRKRRTQSANAAAVEAAPHDHAELVRTARSFRAAALLRYEPDQPPIFREVRACPVCGTAVSRLVFIPPVRYVREARTARPPTVTPTRSSDYWGLPVAAPAGTSPYELPVPLRIKRRFTDATIRAAIALFLESYPETESVTRPSALLLHFCKLASKGTPS